MQVIEHPELGVVHLKKRRGQKHIRLRIDDQGSIVVSMPHWISYSAGLLFVNQKRDWIREQKSKLPVRQKSFNDETPIGKMHMLVYEGIEEGSVRTRIAKDTIKVYIPDNLTPESPDVIKKTTKACERALLIECDNLLQSRLKSLSLRYELPYRSLNFKKLKRRWGSCDSQKNIVINIYLMQLPWELIDYVLVHELVHTKHMHHQTTFWNTVAEILPNYKELKKEIKKHQTLIYTSNPLTL